MKRKITKSERKSIEALNTISTGFKNLSTKKKEKFLLALGALIETADDDLKEFFLTVYFWAESVKNSEVKDEK